MNKLFLTALAGGLVGLASCSQEEVTKPEVTGEPMSISFRAGMSTRVNPDLNFTQNPATFYVTAYKNSHKAVDGALPTPLFQDLSFYLMSASLYTSPDNPKWPTRQEAEQVEFFAYAPSLKEIQDAAFTQLDPNEENYQTLLENYKAGIQFYNLCQDGVALDPLHAESSTFDDVQLYKGFKLGRFYVATDISKQIDFITAHVSHETPKDETSSKVGVELKFKHQLSNIELRGFSANPDFNIEIAGVRIGGAYTGGAIFNFCDADGNTDNPDGGQWGISKNPDRLPMEYIYGPGDEIYRMGKFNTLNGTSVITTQAHTSSDGALTIMGKGGNAMVLPTKNGAWALTANPYIAQKYGAEDDDKNPLPWSVDQNGDMYFSILLRVTLKPKGNEVTTAQIYPYGNNTTMYKVYIEKEKNSNKIVRRVADKTVNPGTNNEIVEFGWAAVPVGVNWERGKKYIYTLDFSKGVGFQDPEDPEPGKPLIGSGISFSVSVTDWNEENPNIPPVPAE